MRQELQETMAGLQNAELVFCCALRKDFARKPAYWVEIYRVMRGPSTVYLVAKQWGFIKKDNEKVQDANVSNTILSMKGALSYTAKVLSSKIKGGWMLCEEEFNPNPPKASPFPEEVKMIDAFCRDWKKEPPTPVRKERITKQEKKTLGDRFKSAQRKRRNKAEW